MLQLLQVCVGAVIVVDLGVCLVCVGGGSSVLTALLSRYQEMRLRLLHALLQSDFNGRRG